MPRKFINLGYFQVPDFIFEINISSLAKLVLMNLIRRADRKKDGLCFPSLETIGKDCGVSSKTALKAVRELDKKKLITAKKKGRLYNYKIANAIYLVIDESNDQISKGIRQSQHLLPKELDPEIPEESSHINDAIEDLNSNTQEEISSSQEDNSIVQVNISHEYEKNLPAKEDSVNQTHLIKTQEEILQNSEKTNFGASAPFSLLEASDYFHSLTDKQKKAFDVSARKALGPCQEDSLLALREHRRCFFELLNSAPKCMDGFEHYSITPDLVPSQKEIY